MAYHPNQAHGGAHGQQDIASNFNAMLARSLQPQDDSTGETSSGTPPTTGYEGVYNVPAGVDPTTVLGPSSASQQQILPTDLPIQHFLTSSMLLQLVDKKIYVVLRDDKAFIGILRSYDQFANFVLSETVERIFAPNPNYGKEPLAKYWLLADSYIGTLLVRGENVANAMSVDLDTEEELGSNQQMAMVEFVKPISLAWAAEKKNSAAKRTRAQKKKGLEGDIGMEG